MNLVSYSQKKLALIKEEYLTARPRVMLNRAISFFPAFREIGFLNLNGECVPFPDALPERSGTNITKTTGKSILRSYYCKLSRSLTNFQYTQKNTCIHDAGIKTIRMNSIISRGHIDKKI